MSDIPVPGGGPPSQLTPHASRKYCQCNCGKHQHLMYEAVLQRICTTPCHGSHFQLSWPWGVTALLLLFTLGFPIRRTNLGNRSTKRAPFNGVQSPTVADLRQRNQEKWMSLKTGYFQFQWVIIRFLRSNLLYRGTPSNKIVSWGHRVQLLLRCSNAFGKPAANLTAGGHSRETST